MWTIQGNNSQGMGPSPAMNGLSACINRLVMDGYRECFKVTVKGLYSTSRSRYYRPEQVQIVETRRFDCQLDPSDNAVVYVVETSDGLKGTLVDACGAYSDSILADFTTEVENIRKKMSGHNRNFC